MTTTTNAVGALETAIPAPRVPQAFGIAETFGIPAPPGLALTGWSQPGPLTPPARLDYCFRPGVLSDLRYPRLAATASMQSRLKTH